MTRMVYVVGDDRRVDENSFQLQTLLLTAVIVQQYVFAVFAGVLSGCIHIKLIFEFTSLIIPICPS